MKFLNSNLCCPYCSGLLTILNCIVESELGVTVLKNIVNTNELRGQHNIQSST